MGILTRRVCLCPQDQNVFDSKKKVKLTSTEGVEHKLARMQLQAIDFNKALLAMYTNQVTLATGEPQRPGNPSVEP